MAWQITKSDRQLHDTARIINQAALVLQQGGIVLFPCDTVWGILSAQLTGNAIEKINSLKQRPLNQPVAVLQTIQSKEASIIFKHIYNNIKIRSYFPSLLTLILPLKKLGKLESKYRMTASEKSEVGIRIVARKHPIEILIKATDSLLATSANLHHASTPLHLDQIDISIKSKVDYVALINPVMTRAASAVFNISTGVFSRGTCLKNSTMYQADNDFIEVLNYLK